MLGTLTGSLNRNVGGFVTIAMGHSSVLFQETLLGCSPWDTALKNTASNTRASAVTAELSRAIANNAINHKRLISKALQGKAHSMNNEILWSGL